MLAPSCAKGATTRKSLLDNEQVGLKLHVLILSVIVCDEIFLLGTLMSPQIMEKILQTLMDNANLNGIPAYLPYLNRMRGKLHQQIFTTESLIL